MTLRTCQSMDELRYQLSEVTSDPNASVSLPPACYSDDTVFAYEADAVFHHSWVGIGRSDRWKSRGDYTAMDIAGVPVIIIRDDGGELKGFANICFPEDTVKGAEFESRSKHYYARYNAALDEDLPFLEQQQVGLSSKFAKPGRFSSLEPGVANFAHWYAGKLASTLK